MALIDDFKARFPEHDPLVIDAQWSFLESSWPAYYGGSYNIKEEKEVILQLISHLFVVEVEMNQTMGGVLDDDKDQFLQTKYGQTFRTLIKHNGGITSV